VVDQALGIERLEPLGGERRPGAVAQQPFEPAPVIRFDAHGCIQGEPAAVAPQLHLLAVVLVHDPALLEGPQDAAADLGLYRLGILRIHLVDSVETYPARRVGLEYAVDDADMDVCVQVERGAEAMDEGHRGGACIRPHARAVRTQVTLDLVEEDAQGAVERLAVMLDVVAQPLR